MSFFLLYTVQQFYISYTVQQEIFKSPLPILVKFTYRNNLRYKYIFINEENYTYILFFAVYF